MHMTTSNLLAAAAAATCGQGSDCQNNAHSVTRHRHAQQHGEHCHSSDMCTGNTCSSLKQASRTHATPRGWHKFQKCPSTDLITSIVTQACVTHTQTYGNQFISEKTKRPPRRHRERDFQKTLGLLFFLFRVTHFLKNRQPQTRPSPFHSVRHSGSRITPPPAEWCSTVASNAHRRYLMATKLRKRRIRLRLAKPCSSRSPRLQAIETAKLCPRFQKKQTTHMRQRLGGDCGDGMWDTNQPTDNTSLLDFTEALGHWTFFPATRQARPGSRSHWDMTAEWQYLPVSNSDTLQDTRIQKCLETPDCFGFDVGPCPPHSAVRRRMRITRERTKQKNHQALHSPSCFQCSGSQAVCPYLRYREPKVKKRGTNISAVNFFPSPWPARINQLHRFVDI